MASTIEVFEVGIEQLRGFGIMLPEERDSLRVGSYVIANSWAMFGEWCGTVLGFLRSGDESDIVRSYEGLYANDLYFMALSDTSLKCGNEYEVWHVLDDADVWADWEYGVAKAKRERNEPTDYHVYLNEGCRCVLDLEHMPTCLYRLKCITATFEDYSDEWYEDEAKFADALGWCVFHGWMPWLSCVKDMQDCVSIVDDDCYALDDYGDGVVLQVTCKESC